MMRPTDGEDPTAGPGEDDATAATPMSVQDVIEALRPPLTSYRQRGGLSSWRVQLLIGVLAALVVWPLAAWEPGDEPIKAEVAGETLERTAPTATTTPPAPSTTVTSAQGTTTTTATTAVPAVTAPPTTVPPPPPTTTTSTTATTTSTTTTTAPRPKAIRKQTTSQLVPGLQLTLTASPPPSGEARVAVFQLAAEFGDSRVLRAAHFEFGDDTGADAAVRAWGCSDPEAPNPYLLSGPAHTYGAAGTYAVTVTVRTATCLPGQEEPVSEATAEILLLLAVT
jgi:hypothetical protein